MVGEAGPRYPMGTRANRSRTALSPLAYQHAYVTIARSPDGYPFIRACMPGERAIEYRRALRVLRFLTDRFNRRQS